MFFLLADHIDFAIQRMQKHINLQLPLFYEVKHLYPQEAELARVALEIIQKDLGVKLPKEEQAAITLHFVNFQLQPKQNAAVDDEQLIEDITLMLQQELKISINRLYAREDCEQADSSDQTHGHT